MKTSPSSRRRRLPATARGTIGLLFICTMSVPGAARAQPVPDASIRSDSSSTRPVVRHPVVGREDALLGALFFGSLASIEVEGFDEIDDLIGPRPRTVNAAHRSFGRALGRLEVALGLSATTWLAGQLAGSETTARLGLRGVETLLLNAGVTTVLKVGFGRSRPDSGLEEDRFDPFAFKHSSWSFPSGHTSTVFALATTLSLELKEGAPWVPFVAYPIAGWTGISRVLDQKHWLTDVVAGAAVGILSARIVHRLHAKPLYTPEGRFGVTPRLLLAQDRGELMVGVSLAH